MGWIPSSATNVILNWPERIKTQPHDDRDNCFLPFDSKNGPCGMTMLNDIDDDSATEHSDFHNSRKESRCATSESTMQEDAREGEQPPRSRGLARRARKPKKLAQHGTPRPGALEHHHLALTWFSFPHLCSQDARMLLLESPVSLSPATVHCHQLLLE